MIYILRKNDGTIDSVSSGTFIDKDGNTDHLKSYDFNVEAADYWTSSATNIRYPSNWTIKVPKYNLKIEVQPLLNNQEFNHSFTYWEGAVKAEGDNITGQGYVELTGY